MITRTTVDRIMEATDAEDKLKRIYAPVEQGLIDVDDILKDRLNVLKPARHRAKVPFEQAESHAASTIRIDPTLIERFDSSVREIFSAGSAPFREASSQSGPNWCSQKSIKWHARRDSNS